MDILLWTFQIVLAAVFLASGATKSWMPKERLIAIGQTGVRPLPMPLVRFGAILEIPGAIGVIVPWATGIVPVLTPLAAVGFSIIMVVAISSHAYLIGNGPAEKRTREIVNTIATSGILVMSLTVAIARFGQL